MSYLSVLTLSLLIFGQIPRALAAERSGWSAPVPYLNQFGGSPTPADDDPRFKAAVEFMSHARPGGTLKLGTFESIFSVYPSSIRRGDFKPRAPNTDQFIYETLMAADPRRLYTTVYPLIAREVRTMPDHCRLAVTLRDDVTFSDGQPLRTADVVRSVDVMLHEFYTGGMEALIKRLYGEIVVTARDDLNFELEFKGLAVSQCRQAAYYVMGSVPMIKPSPSPRFSRDVDMPYLGTGPYRVTFADRTRVRMAKAQAPEATRYWGAVHPLRHHVFNPDVIETVAYLDQTMERFALLRGDVSLMREKAFTFDEWMKSYADGRHPFERVDQISDKMDTEVGAIWMNQRHADTGTREFRRALVLIWNFSSLNHDVFADRRHAAPTFAAQSALAPRGDAPAAVREILADVRRRGSGAADDRDERELQSALRPADDLEYARLEALTGRRSRMAAALKLLNRAGYHFERVAGRTRLVKDGRPVVLKAIAKSESTETKLFLTFQRDLASLGIELNLRWYPDRSSLVDALSNNEYDLYPGTIDIPRNFEALNMNYVAHGLHSRSRDTLGAWGRIDSKLLDVTVEYLETQRPGTAEYKAGADALLRAINANVPVLLSGEIDPVVLYHARGLRVWSEQEKDIQTLYFESGSN